MNPVTNACTAPNHMHQINMCLMYLTAVMQLQYSWWPLNDHCWHGSNLLEWPNYPVNQPSRMLVFGSKTSWWSFYTKLWFRLLSQREFITAPELFHRQPSTFFLLEICIWSPQALVERYMFYGQLFGILAWCEIGLRHNLISYARFVWAFFKTGDMNGCEKVDDIIAIHNGISGKKEV